MDHPDPPGTRPAGDADLPSSLPRLDTPLGECSQMREVLDRSTFTIRAAGHTLPAFCTGVRDEGRGRQGARTQNGPACSGSAETRRLGRRREPQNDSSDKKRKRSPRGRRFFDYHVHN